MRKTEPLPAENNARDRAGERRSLSLGRLPGLLGYTLRRAQLRVFQDFAASMDGEGLTPGQIGALLLIKANRGLSQSDLGVALGIDRSSVVPLIDRLQARDLVRRAAHASDRRAHALELSEAGEAALIRLLSRLEAHERRIAAHLSAGERRTLMDLLARVADG
ncbi:MAG: MarR family transcriptional regulator [Rhodospirillales bacterium]|nr:MarR family transcriptional regulator [Rhodospirillales bacterium]